MVFEKEKPEETFCRIKWKGGDVVGALFPSFQTGVWVMVPAGIPIGSLLEGRWGLSREFIEKTVVRVQVKLFNRLIEDLGRIVLRHGILLEKDQALQCVVACTGSTRAMPRRVTVNGDGVSFDSLPGILINRKSMLPGALALCLIPCPSQGRDPACPLAKGKRREPRITSRLWT